MTLAAGLLLKDSKVAVVDRRLLHSSCQTFRIEDWEVEQFVVLEWVVGRLGLLCFRARLVVVRCVRLVRTNMQH